MTEQPEGPTSVASLDHVLGHFEGRFEESVRTELLTILIDREDNMADFLRLAGIQFGLFPQIVAKVLMDCGMGKPVDDTTRALINAQFTATMEELQRQFGHPES